MSIEESAVRARQGGKGRDILVVLLVSTALAVLLVWGVMALWVGNNTNVNDTAVSPGEATISDFTAEDTVNVNPQAQAGAPAETDATDSPVLQSDEPNPATQPGGPN